MGLAQAGIRGLSYLGRKGLFKDRGNVSRAAAGARSFLSQNAGRLDTIGNLLPYAPSALQAIGGDPLSGALSAGATRLAGKYAPIVGLVSPLVTPSILGGVGNVAKAGVNAYTNTQRERAESAGFPGGKGIEFDTAKAVELMQQAGMTQIQIAEALNPRMNENLDRQQQRQMQLNQQLGQLTGALNQQKYMAQLAAGAQAEAGATTRNMINTVNPYADSVFRYQG